MSCKRQTQKLAKKTKEQSNYANVSVDLSEMPTQFACSYKLSRKLLDFYLTNRVVNVEL